MFAFFLNFLINKCFTQHQIILVSFVSEAESLCFEDGDCMAASE